jgi:hypothetical protein
MLFFLTVVSEASYPFFTIRQHPCCGSTEASLDAMHVHVQAASTQSIK